MSAKPILFYTLTAVKKIYILAQCKNIQNNLMENLVQTES